MALKKVSMTAFILTTLISLKTMAASYPLPAENQALIGDIQSSYVTSGETVTTLSERFDIGFNAIEKANPNIDFKKPILSHKKIIIPTQHLLPPQARKGIVVNLPEMRMYYYLEDSQTVVTYPIGIGKIGKTIPVKEAVITRKAKDPVWVPTEDIRQFNLAQGIVLPQVMPPGPENPLGPYAIYMSIPTYLMHSTIYPESIGKRASFGCIRMYQSDIKDFFPTVNKGIPVLIINSPVKVAWQNNHILMEAHTGLEETNESVADALPDIVHQIYKLTSQKPVLVDWQAVAFIEKERDGLPHEIGMKIRN